VEEVDVAVGDKVSVGTQLANLEKTSLPQNIILAEAELATAQKSLEDLYSNAELATIEAQQSIAAFTQRVRDAQFSVDNFTIPSNQSEYETTEALRVMKERLDLAREAFEPYKYKSSSDPNRQDLRGKLEEAQSDYNSAVRRLEIEYELAVAEANLEQALRDFEKFQSGPSQQEIDAAEARIAAAEATLEQVYIQAPFNGTITVSKPKVGDQVAVNMEAFRLDDLSRLLLDVQVSEVDINRIEVGQDVIFSFDAILGKEYKGKVVEVAPVGTSDQGIVDFTVTVEITNPDEKVKPGMTAAVNIVVSELSDILLVPNRAVRIKDGQRVVYVLRNDETVAVEITLGASSDTMSEVLEGELEIGDLIVLNPPTEFESNGPPPFVRR
jgi:HlyD family secretion protein